MRSFGVLKRALLREIAFAGGSIDNRDKVALHFKNGT